MDRQDLLRAVARRTGDNLTTIKRIGFQLDVVLPVKVRFHTNQPSPLLITFAAKSKAHHCLEKSRA